MTTSGADVHRSAGPFLRSDDYLMSSSRSPLLPASSGTPLRNSLMFIPGTCRVPERAWPRRSTYYSHEDQQLGPSCAKDYREHEVLSFLLPGVVEDRACTSGRRRAATSPPTRVKMPLIPPLLASLATVPTTRWLGARRLLTPRLLLRSHLRRQGHRASTGHRAAEQSGGAANNGGGGYRLHSGCGTVTAISQRGTFVFYPAVLRLQSFRIDCAEQVTALLGVQVLDVGIVANGILVCASPPAEVGADRGADKLGANGF